MVADFARDEYKLDDAQVATIMQKVREGDLTMVLKAWEQDIKVRVPASSSHVGRGLILIRRSGSDTEPGQGCFPRQFGPVATHPDPKGQGRRRSGHERDREDASEPATHVRLCRRRSFAHHTCRTRTVGDSVGSGQKISRGKRRQTG
jgi:ATP synthase regulation protein NCA2